MGRPVLLPLVAGIEPLFGSFEEPGISEFFLPSLEEGGLSLLHFSYKLSFWRPDWTDGAFVLSGNGGRARDDELVATTQCARCRLVEF